MFCTRMRAHSTVRARAGDECILRGGPGMRLGARVRTLLRARAGAGAGVWWHEGVGALGWFVFLLVGWLVFVSVFVFSCSLPCFFASLLLCLFACLLLCFFASLLCLCACSLVCLSGMCTFAVAAVSVFALVFLWECLGSVSLCPLRMCCARVSLCVRASLFVGVRVSCVSPGRQPACVRAWVR